jgi:hypothetical protein
MCKNRLTSNNKLKLKENFSDTMSSSSGEINYSPRSSSPSTTIIESNNNKELMKDVMRKRAAAKSSSKHSYDYISYILLTIVILLTYFTYPSSERKVTLQHVWYNGWITAVATGAGALPFFFLNEPNKFWMGVSNGKSFFSLLLSSFLMFPLFSFLFLHSHSRWYDACCFIKSGHRSC